MLSTLKTKQCWYSGTASRIFWKSWSFCSRVFLETWVRLKTFARFDLGILSVMCWTFLFLKIPSNSVCSKLGVRVYKYVLVVGGCRFEREKDGLRAQPRFRSRLWKNFQVPIKKNRGGRRDPAVLHREVWQGSCCKSALYESTGYSASVVVSVQHWNGAP